MERVQRNKSEAEVEINANARQCCTMKVAQSTCICLDSNMKTTLMTALDLHYFKESQGTCSYKVQVGEMGAENAFVAAIVQPLRTKCSSVIQLDLMRTPSKKAGGYYIMKLSLLNVLNQFPFVRFPLLLKLTEWFGFCTAHTNAPLATIDCVSKLQQIIAHDVFDAALFKLPVQKRKK